MLGISIKTTPSTENGKSECLHRTIMNCLDSKLLPNMWGEGMKATSYLKNCTLTRTLTDKTPFEMWYGQHPDISHLCKLGCKVWVHVAGESPKIYNQYIECILFGYSDNSKTYCCLEWSTGCIHISCNMFFTESQDLREHLLPPGSL